MSIAPNVVYLCNIQYVAVHTFHLEHLHLVIKGVHCLLKLLLLAVYVLDGLIQSGHLSLILVIQKSMDITIRHKQTSISDINRYQYQKSMNMSSDINITHKHISISDINRN